MRRFAKHPWCFSIAIIPACRQSSTSALLKTQLFGILRVEATKRHDRSYKWCWELRRVQARVQVQNDRDERIKQRSDTHILARFFQNAEQECGAQRPVHGCPG